MKLGVSILLIGIGGLVYSISLEPYTDGQLFVERYREAYGQSHVYWEIRDEMLTPKYAIQDYAGTVCLIGASLMLLAWASFSAPKARWLLAALLVLAPIVSIASYVFDIGQVVLRGDAPPWADSPGIPLMVVPPLFIGLAVWAFGHLFFLKAPYQPGMPLRLAFSRYSNFWLRLVALGTALLICLFVVGGAYWMAAPGMLWLYVYLSLAAGRRIEEQCARTSVGLSVGSAIQGMDDQTR